jgi:hypothetical protein
VTVAGSITPHSRLAPVEPLRTAAYIAEYVFSGERSRLWVVNMSNPKRDDPIPRIQVSPQKFYFHESRVREWLARRTTG